MLVHLDTRTAAARAALPAPGSLSRRCSAWFELGGEELRRLQPMEGLRAIAVLLVFCVHYASQAQRWAGDGINGAVVGAMCHLGNLGVDLFFVISGYLIYGGLARKARPYGQFLLRRVQRLYPTFAVMLAIYLMLSLLLPSESKLPAGLPQAMLYVAENALLLPGIVPVPPIMVVAWSLSYEMFFYLAVPLLIGLLRLRAWPVAARLVAIPALVAAMILLPFPWPRMGLFATGMFLSELLPLVLRETGYRAWLDPLTLLFLPVAGWLLLPDASSAVWCSVAAVTCLLVTLSAFSHPGPISRFLVLRPLRWIGNASYSYYLVHVLVLKVLFAALPMLHLPPASGPWVIWVMLLPALFATLVASGLLFLLVEKPFSITTPRANHLKPASIQAANASLRGGV